MRNLTAAHLKKIFPDLSREKCERYAPHLSAAVQEANINTRARLCAFVAQLGHESQDLHHLKEIWGPTSAQARYDVRTDLGNTPERDGDGRLYMGRGGIQRTGKKNYVRAAKKLGLPLLENPELLEKPEHAFRSDALYWTDNNLNKIADRLTLRGDAKDLDTFDRITKVVNGGYNGKIDRQSRYIVAIANLPKELFQTEPKPQPEPPTSTASALDRVADHVNNPPAPVPAENPSSDGEKSATPKILLQKLSTKEEARQVAKGAAARLFKPLFWLITALGAGNVYAWLGTIAVAGVIVWLIWREWPAIKPKLSSYAKTIEGWIQ